MDLVEAITILVARIFAPAVTDSFVLIAPHRQTSVDVVLVSVDHRALGNCGINDRFDRLLLNIGQHPEDHLAVTLDQAQDWRFFLFERATAARSFEPSAPSDTIFFWTAAGLPLCPATT